MDSFLDKSVNIKQNLSCAGCGAPLHFKPGTRSLLCTYCGTANNIEQGDLDVVKVSLLPIPIDAYTTAIQKSTINNSLLTTSEIASCKNCGASTTLDPNIVSTNCPFCASPMVIDHHTEVLIKPNALLPFELDHKAALISFKGWGKKLWFAPNDLKEVFNRFSENGLKGVYIPYWSYNAAIDADYEGRQGEYYYVTRNVRGSDGKNSTVRERRTRWYDVSGTVEGNIENVLISASTSLSQSNADKISAWNLDKLVPFDERYLSGFLAQKYQLNHQDALIKAKSKMNNEIEGWIIRDIGGDDQEIDNYEVNYNDVTLRYILLPVYLSSYQYKNKTYTILINAFTGRVYGDRPYSFWKIFFTVLFALVIIAIYFAISS